MLQLLLHFLLITICCFLWGMPLWFYRNKKNIPVTLSLSDFLLSLFAGLAIISVLAAWVSLTLPVQYNLLLFLTAPLLGWFLFSGRQRLKIDATIFRTISIPEWVFLSTIFLLLLFLGTGKPQMEDTDLYHLQNILWSREYGTVKGLANLYPRYGSYSNWFPAISFFNVPFGARNFLYLNHAISTWFVIYLFFQFTTHAKRKERESRFRALYSFLLLCYMLAEWDLLRGAASSTTYDFVVTAFTLLAIDLFLFRNKNEHPPVDYLLMLLLVTAPFFKLTGFLLLPLLVSYLLTRGEKKKPILMAGATFLICLIPFLVKNYWQTGYLIFPYNILPSGNSDWRLPVEISENYSRYVSLSNKYINQTIPQAAWKGEEGFSYVNDWFLHLTLADRFLVTLSLVGLPVSLFLIKRFSDKEGRLKALFLCTAICIIGWLLLAPDTRFAFGWLLFATLFPLGCLLQPFTRRWMYIVAMIMITVAAAWYMVNKGREWFRPQYLFTTEGVDTTPFRTVTTKTGSYHIPERLPKNWNPRCLQTPLPCIYQLNPYLQMRGEKLSEGFRMHPYPDSFFIQQYQY